MPEEKAELPHAIDERILVAGIEIMGGRLTAVAYAPESAPALPEKVALARPTGVRRAGTHFGFERIPIEDASDREAVTATSA